MLASCKDCNTGLWPHFSDVWYHQSYTKFCPIPPNSLWLMSALILGCLLFCGAICASRVRVGTRLFELFATCSKYFSGSKHRSVNYACAAHDGRGSLDVSGSPDAFSLMTGFISLIRNPSMFSAGARNSVRIGSESTACDAHYLKLDCEGAEFEMILEADSSLLNSGSAEL